jgi:hypothetical protein
MEKLGHVVHPDNGIIFSTDTPDYVMKKERKIECILLLYERSQTKRATSYMISIM